MTPLKNLLFFPSLQEKTLWNIIAWELWQKTTQGRGVPKGPG